jgi:hypothetical protein
MNGKRALLPILLLVALLAMALPALAQPGGDFSLGWWTVDGGGGESAGGEFAVLGSMGQADAGALAGGEFELTGGFWHGPALTPTHLYLPIVFRE